MPRSLVSLSFAALALLTPAAAGQDIARPPNPFLYSIERFKLFNACRPMEFAIEPLGDHAAATIGLTEEVLQAAAESRLRPARLYTEDMEKAAAAYLEVNINVVGPAFSLIVNFHKEVTDAFGESGLAPTWASGGVGTHGGNASYIVSFLSQILDKFLAAYLRVNEPACGSAPVQP